MELKDFQQNVSLAGYSIYKIGGPADYLIVVDSEVDLNMAIKVAEKNNLEHVTLENIGRYIANDKGIKGVVIIKNYNLSTINNILFKDVSYDKIIFENLKSKGVIFPIEFDLNQSLSAGTLIKECGLAGKCIGGVCINETNFSVEVKGSVATADEFVQLVSYIKQQVRDTFSIQLEENFEYIGF